MTRSEELSDLIGDIYDTVLDRSLWPDVLKRAAFLLPGASATVIWKDFEKNVGVYFQDGGIDQHYADIYLKTYAKLSPTSTGHLLAEVGEPIATADIIPYEEFLRTRMYREWARPQGLVDFVGATLEKSAAGVAMFGIFRHERHGLADDEARGRMRLLVPHVRRAVLISKVIDLKETEAAMHAETLDGLRAGMFLVDTNGRIVHSNAAGHLLLAEGGVLRAESGRLVSGDPRADETLRETFAAAEHGDVAVGAKGVALSLVARSGERSGERYVAHVLPLTSGLRSGAGSRHSAAAAVFVQRASFDGLSPPEAIASSYKLTPTELRVLLAIVEVGGVPEVAEVLGIAATTVKTHLGRVYEKTGLGRQADLVKLVAGFANPLRGTSKA